MIWGLYPGAFFPFLRDTAADPKNLCLLPCSATIKRRYNGRERKIMMFITNYLVTH